MTTTVILRIDLFRTCIPAISRVVKQLDSLGKPPQTICLRLVGIPTDGELVHGQLVHGECSRLDKISQHLRRMLKPFDVTVEDNRGREVDIRDTPFEHHDIPEMLCIFQEEVYNESPARSPKRSRTSD
ncbi:hypothetical protein C1H76_7437 [Elsinoe australis]|uniref:Uncharacterized protein n=1 Tax=Elsinoe australis TaxID=40998 RepID=A0A4U7AUQ5_9PEZI|nr:hypothetical protein C1H76_7437 [Elsinoe australis]